MIKVSIGRPDYEIRNHSFALFCISRGEFPRLYNERGERILETTDFLCSDPSPSLRSAIKQIKEKLK